MKIIKLLLKEIKRRNMINRCNIIPKNQKHIYYPHPTGIVISEYATIGKNVTIYQNVTIGGRKQGCKKSEYPTIGDNVTIYAGAIITGKITIPNEATIPAGMNIKQEKRKNGKHVFNK